MPDQEEPALRSRAWLVVPGSPLLVLTGISGGPVLALVAAVVMLQWALLAPRAQPAANTVAGGLAGAGRRTVTRTGPAMPGAGRRTASFSGRVALAARRLPHATWVLTVRVLPLLVGSLVLVAALDWGVGAAWDRAFGDRPTTTPDVRDLASEDLPPARDPRVQVPALEGSPWAAWYFAELEALTFSYQPYLGPRERTVRGRHINSEDGVRRSYEPTGLGEDGTFDVWFLGGSTMWGEGQRDGHTIPSEVARIAEDAGVPLRAWNFGIRGYTAFQEYLVFEQEVARRGAPDLAVFYHGVNEAQSLLESPDNLGSQPSIYQIETYIDAFGRAPPLPGHVPAPEPSFAVEYHHTSVLDKLWRAAAAWVGPPAAADERYEPPTVDVERAQREAAQIYRRSVALIRHETDAHDVPALIFWQPGPEWEPLDFGRNWYTVLGAQVATAGGGIDLSEVLQDVPTPVYIDGVHTNELGARLVAEALWVHIGPELRQLSDP